jgi:hypothetical protein
MANTTTALMCLRHMMVVVHQKGEGWLVVVGGWWWVVGGWWFVYFLVLIVHSFCFVLSSSPPLLLSSSPVLSLVARLPPSFVAVLVAGARNRHGTPHQRHLAGVACSFVCHHRHHHQQRTRRWTGHRVLGFVDDVARRGARLVGTGKMALGHGTWTEYYTHCFIVSLFHCFIVSLFHCFIVSLFHCFIVSLFHCFVMYLKDFVDLDDETEIVRLPFDERRRMPLHQRRLYRGVGVGVRTKLGCGGQHD